MDTILAQHLANAKTLLPQDAVGFETIDTSKDIDKARPAELCQTCSDEQFFEQTSALSVCGPCATRLVCTLNQLEEDLDIENEKVCQLAINSTINDALRSLDHKCGQAFIMNIFHAFTACQRCALIGTATNAVISTWSITALRKRGFSKKLAKTGLRGVMLHIVTMPDGSLPSWCEE